MCLSSDRLVPMLADLKGLDFPKLVTRPLSALPEFIPQLTNPWFHNELPLDYPVVAVGINRVSYGSGSINSNLLRAGSVQRWLNLNPNTRVMLIGCAKDEVLEDVWENSRVTGFFDALYSLGFSSMTAMNFSIYFTEPRLEHLVNLKRSAESAVEAANAGLSAIPHIHWARNIDLERMAQWLGQERSVTAVAFNVQTYQTERLWKRAMDGILYFNSLMNRPLTYIVIGASSFPRIRGLSSLAKLVLISTRPYMMAQHGQALNSRRELQRFRPWSRAELFYDNLRTVIGAPGRSHSPSA